MMGYWVFSSYLNYRTIVEINRHNTRMEDLDKEYNDQLIELKKAKQFWLEGLNTEDIKG